jgi:hypothetical protein
MEVLAAAPERPRARDQRVPEQRVPEQAPGAGALAAILSRLDELAAREPIRVTVEPPQVTVEAARPPDVHVTVQPPQRPGAVRAVKNEDGTTVFTVEDKEEGS